MRILVFLGLVCGALWSLFIAVDFYGLFEGSYLKSAFHVAALTLSGLFVILLLGWLVIEFGFGHALGLEPSSLTRVVVYGVLTFAVSAVVLRYLGFDIAAVLTTSALLTAIVGLAMQPTLGSLISGLAMQLDRALSVGDGIFFNGEQVEVLSLNWRNVVMRKRDETILAVPNAMLANEQLTIYPEDRSTRFDSYVLAPIDVSPQRITDMLAETVTDMEQIDRARPVMVAPVEMRPEAAVTKYRVRYFLRFYMQFGEVDGEIVRRAWYVFQRNGVLPPPTILHRSGQDLPMARAFDPEADLMAALAEVLPPDQRGEETFGKILCEGRPLMYAPTERIVLPRRERGRCLLLVRGRVRADERAFMTPIEHGRTAQPYLPPLSVQRLPRTAALWRVADRLAEAIGPYAELAVRDAAHEAKTIDELIARLAGEIDDAAARAQFIEAIECKDVRCFGPGFVADIDEDVSGRLLARPHLRAEDEVVFLSVPKELLARGKTVSLHLRMA